MKGLPRFPSASVRPRDRAAPPAGARGAVQPPGSREALSGPRPSAAHLRGRHCEPPGVHTLCNLRTLLDQLQRAHRHEVALYTSGHLNPNNLYRPPEVVLHHWRNANRPAPGPTPGAQKAPDKKVAAMRDALAHFTVHTAVSPSEARGTRLFGYLHPPAPGPPASEEDVAAQPGAGRGPLRRRREELRWPELKVLRFRPPRSSRGCPLAAPGGDELCYVSSYLAGVTRADKYRRFLSFQRDVLATRDRLPRDFTGRGVATGHEKRLERVRRAPAWHGGRTAAAPGARRLACGPGLPALSTLTCVMCVMTVRVTRRGAEPEAPSWRQRCR